MLFDLNELVVRSSVASSFGNSLDIQTSIIGNAERRNNKMSTITKNRGKLEKDLQDDDNNNDSEKEVVTA